MTTTTVSVRCSDEAASGTSHPGAPAVCRIKSPPPTPANLLKAADLFEQLADDATDWGRLMSRLADRVRLMAAPLDLDALVKAGKLQRLSATRYRVLCDDLPDHVWARAVHFEAGPVLHFQPRRSKA